MFIVNEFLYILIFCILLVSTYVSSYVILKGLFKDRVGMFFIAELFLMVFLMIIILIADVIKILVSGVMEAKISIIGIMDVKRFLERLGIKESDFVDLNTLRSKISGLIEETTASGDQTLATFLKESQANVDTAIVSGMKPQIVVTFPGFLTMIFSMNTGTETANAIVSKA